MCGLAAIAGIAVAAAASGADSTTVTALQAPAWLLHEGEQFALERGRKLDEGDRIRTGEGGIAIVALGDLGELGIDSGSEATPTARAADAARAQVLLHGGRLCLGARTLPDSGSLRVAIADRVFVEIQDQAEFCAERHSDLVRLQLHAGNVLVSQVADPSLIVLSRAGVEARIEDNGYFELQYPETLAPPPEPRAADEAGAANAAAAAESGGSVEAGDYMYTVYLFSSRDEDVALAANQRFLRAGHHSVVLVSDENDATRYRVAVPGFESRQAAQAFADEVVGTLGIANTWIGRQKKR